MDSNTIAMAAETWYGYGRWDAPFWFIGPEPGMAKREGENLQERCDAWQQLGSPELLDCAQHHAMFKRTEFYDRTIRMRLPVTGQTKRPPTQSTWRRLIQLLLAFKGERTDIDAVADYQCRWWGSANGETCVVEISALAANNQGVQRDRDDFQHLRCQTLQTRLSKNMPRFAVMYGLAERESYERIVGALFDSDGYAWAGQTLCALIEHPAARPGKPPAWWITKGREIRAKAAYRA